MKLNEIIYSNVVKKAMNYIVFSVLVGHAGKTADQWDSRSIGISH